MGNLHIRLKRANFNPQTDTVGLMWVVSYGSFTVSIGKKKYNTINLYLNGCRIPNRLWDVIKHNHRLKESDYEFKIVLERIDKSRTRLYELCTELLRTNNLNNESLKSRLSNDSIWRDIFNLEGIIYCNDVAVTDYIKKFVKDSTDVQEKTKRIYSTVCNLLETFEKSRHTKYSFVSFNLFVFNAFKSFLEQSKEESTVFIYLSKIKAMFERAYQEGLNVTDEYRRFKYTDSKRRDNVKILSKEQIEAIKNITFTGTELKIKKKEKMRDMFLIEVELGCRYSDYKQLKRENIRHTDKLDVMIFEPQKQSHNKTCKKAYIPISDTAKKILEKYDYQLDGEYSGYNRFLTELGKMIGIKPDKVSKSGNKIGSLSSHWGRHTFITNALSRGMRDEEVMAITGHKSLSAFKSYVHVSDEDNARNVMKSFYESLKIA